MRVKSQGTFICGLSLLTICAGHALAADESANGSLTSRKAEASAAFAQLPSRFEANQGQVDARVRFLSRASDHTLFLTPNEAVLVLRGSTEPRNPSAVDAQSAGFSAGITAPPPLCVRMIWIGSNPDPQVIGVDEIPGKSNYFIGDQPSNWRRQVPLYSKVRYREIYPGVDVLYYGNEGKLEYDLIVSPGADPQKIRLRFGGAKKIRINAQGDIVLKFGGRSVILHKPVVYQETGLLDAPKQYLESSYVAKNPHEFGFQIGPYDPERALVIDPALSYSTYLGGSNGDQGYRVAADAGGNAYVVGYTNSTDFPIGNAMQPSSRGSTDVFIAKINAKAPGASSLVYSTYLGGSGSDFGRGIAIDAIGGVYIVGDTNSTNFPVTPGAFQPACKGPCTQNAFVAKIDSSGSSLLYSSYLGGSSFDLAFSVGLDSSNRMYLTGSTTSSDFPTTPGAFQTSYGGGSQFFGDAYLAVVNPVGNGASDLNYSTYIGGSGQELAWGLAVDNLGFAYVTGGTVSTNFPITASAFQPTFAGTGGLGLGGDGFLVKLNPAGLGSRDLLYSTYFGGSGDERGEGVAVDGSGFVYLTGMTNSTNFPVTPNAFQLTHGTGTCQGAVCADAIIMKWDLRASGASSLLYSTFLGGTGFDLGHGIAVDSNSIVYVAGETDSNNFPLVSPIQTACGGACPFPVPDVFIAKLDPSQSGAAGLLFSTYLGGSGTDTGQSIAIDSQGNAYVTGQAYSSNFPTMMPFQPFCKNCSSSSDDGFLAKVCITACPSSAASPPTLAFGSQTVGSASSSQPVLLSNPGTGDLTIISITAPTGFLQSNSCGIVLSAGSNCTINVSFSPQSAGPASGSLTIASNASATSTGVGLSGTGFVVTLAASPSGLTYAAQQVGTTSASQPVTLSNSGGTSVAVTGIQASGDFAQTNNCGASVAANSSCIVNVTFAPTASGSRIGTLTITDSASNSPQTVSLAGTGAAPVITVSTNSLTFAAQVLGSSSTSQLVTVSNIGTAAANVSSITASGDFGQTNNCGTSLAATTSCTVNVTFTPTATGTRTGTLTIADNAASSPQTVSLTGTGANAVLNASPAALSFAAQAQGSTSASQPVTLSNSGGTSVAVTGIQASGDFAQTNNCGISVAASSSCTVNVTFTPTASGTRNGALTITDSASNSPQMVSFTGTGGTLTLNVSPTNLSFGITVVGVPSPGQSVTLSNSGTLPIALSNLQTTGDYAQANNCGTTVNPGSSCVVNVTFQPTTFGSRLGSLVVTDNATNSPQNVALSGTGTIAQVSVGWSVIFGGTPVGTSANQAFTITNVGAVPLTVSSLSFAGLNPGDYSQTNTCTTAGINPGGSCTVTVTFAPTATGSRFAILWITENGGASPLGLRVSGTGQ
jgi:beta-propeller repeat-containing protein/ASPM-SPD-2-Hydin domain-containing protein/centrosomal CEP192-like protein